MSIAAPRLADAPASDPATVSLSASPKIEFQIEDPDISASARVAIIVGDLENLELKGEEVAAGKFDEEQFDYVKTDDLRAYLDSASLKRFEGQTKNVRYRVRGESGESESDALRVKFVP